MKDNMFKLFVVALLFALTFSACDGAPPNSPWPRDVLESNTLLTSFSSPPKHLDPAQSYSSNEIAFTAQIYEPPLEYHYLKRPYELQPLTATGLPEVRYIDEQGRTIAPADTDTPAAFSIYTIRIQPGILYQPHPALARHDNGDLMYTPLPSELERSIYAISDFPHTGTRELRASDYVFQIKRLADPRLHSPLFGIMTEHIVGLRELGNELREAARTLSDGESLDLESFELSGVRSLDDHTYEIKLYGRYPQFSYWLTMAFFAPVPPEAERFFAQDILRQRNISLDTAPIGTGPFYMTTYQPHREIVLERNPHYRGMPYPHEGEEGDAEAGLLADAGQTMPFLDRAIYKLEKEQIPFWNKFLQGYYDASGIASDSFDQVIGVDASGSLGLSDEMAERGIRLLTSASTTSFYLGFNMRDPVIGGLEDSRRKLRQAISIAIDYEEFIAIFLNGRGIPGMSPIPPGITGHIEGERGINPITHIWDGREARRRDVRDARALLAEAGYPGGIDPATGQPLVLYFDVTATGPDSRADLDWMRKQFEKLGIELTIRNTDYNRFQDKIRTGNAQIFRWGWGADYPDPENFLFLLYSEGAVVDSGGNNSANYSSPEFDKLFLQLRNMHDGPTRDALIDEAIDVLRRDAPWAFGFHPVRFELNHPWLFNGKPHEMANNTLKYRRVDGQLRTAAALDMNRPVLWPFLVVTALLLVLLLPLMLRRRGRSQREATL